MYYVMVQREALVPSEPFISCCENEKYYNLPMTKKVGFQNELSIYV